MDPFFFCSEQQNSELLNAIFFSPHSLPNSQKNPLFSFSRFVPLFTSFCMSRDMKGTGVLLMEQYFLFHKTIFSEICHQMVNPLFFFSRFVPLFTSFGMTRDVKGNGRFSNRDLIIWVLLMERYFLFHNAGFSKICRHIFPHVGFALNGNLR